MLAALERGAYDTEPGQARIALLEGERRSFDNVKLDLMRRIKMLEYALRVERCVCPLHVVSCPDVSAQVKAAQPARLAGRAADEARRDTVADGRFVPQGGGQQRQLSPKRRCAPSQTSHEAVRLSLA